MSETVLEKPVEVDATPPRPAVRSSGRHAADVPLDEHAPTEIVARRRPALVVLAWGLLAFLIWFATGIVTVDLLDSVHIRPIWWVAASAIPAAVILAFVHRSALDDARLASRVLLTAVIGGPIAIVLAATVNRIVIPDVSAIGWVGLTEEGSKLLATLLVAWGIRKTARSGLLLGVVVGLGFAVWESAGYFYDEYASETSWVEAMQDIGERMLGLGLHPLFAGLVACAVFAAIARPRVLSVAAAVVSFAAVAATHSGYDWVLSNADISVLGVPMSIWPPVVVTAGLLVGCLIAVRLILRGTRPTDGRARSEHEQDGTTAL